jgi:PPOX class probable F420-dependent enzyme
MMKPQKQSQLFSRKLRAFLSRARVARLATLNEDGTIHIVPIVFANDSTRIYFAVDNKPKKTKNLRRLANIRRNPNATILIDKYSEDWAKLSFVMIYARAKIISSNDRNGKRNHESRIALRLLKQKYPQYRTGDFLPSRTESITLVSLTPSKIVAWDAESASKPSLK